MYITSPTQINPANLRLWLDASDTTTLYSLSSLTDPLNTPVNTSGQPVGYWGDKSGNNRHFTYVRAASPIVRPTFFTNIANGKPVIRFNGAQFLNSLFTETFANQTIFMVIRFFDSGVSNARIYSQTNADNTDNAITFGIPFYHTSYRTIYTYADGGNKAGFNYRNTQNFDSICHQRAGGVVTNFTNGGGYSNGSYTSILTTSFTTFATRIGCGFAGNFTTISAPGKFEVAEVIVYNSILATWERLSIEYYLAQKWGLPRTIYGLNYGNWSNTNTWTVSGYTAPYNVPNNDIKDYVYLNANNITVDVPNISVSFISNQTAGSPVNSAGGGNLIQTTTSLNLSTENIYCGAFPMMTVPTASSLNLFGNGYIGTPNGQFTGSIIALSGTTVYLSGYNAPYDTGGQTYTSMICAMCANVIFENCNFLQPVNWKTRLTHIGNQQYVKIKNCIVGEDVNVDTRGNNFIILGQNTKVYIEDSKIYHTATGSGAYGENINIQSLNGEVYVKNCLLKTPQTQSGSGEYCIYLSNTLSAYFDNCNFITDISQAYSSTVGCVYIGSNVLCRINNSKFSQYSFTYSILNNGVLILSSMDMNNLTPCTIYSSTPTISVYNYNILNDRDGFQAIYGPSFKLINGKSSYIKQSINASDSYYFYTSGATFTYPNTSDVRYGTNYKNASLTGTMIVPPPSSVIFGSGVDNTVGTALLTFDSIVNLPINQIPNDNSIGARIKDITTTQAFTAIVLNSLGFSNYY